ncbi:hypothetical protein CANARDRAFT_201741 [[Candida] arabinofermentans NRRL YB-2248]|uniref:GPI inositol-deacylase n=1 Tax=[Candida] arabinofermentans NRRL YB-2248 TaxID=983967 RepID=A0A1E4SX96_9ASCO|nr:hypothetical protein CANARDRAFT_201741 [[Candida] arabinofermentans NRRL YB-2248]
MSLHIPSNKHNHRLQSSKYILLFLTICGLTILSLIGFSFIENLEGADSASCRGVYMSPAYARVNGFDETHTKFASKYSLYLYREQGKDVFPRDSETVGAATLRLEGTPVLFIPGNAGSYKQVRSIASQCANTFYDNQDQLKQMNSGVNNLDFFTADFNEDFTAFHGRTMLDQAEYLNDAISFILTLYKNNPTPATSVILVGHSMGGIVARVMLSLPNYVEDSVNTIITLAAPHAAAPTTFDADLLHVFSSTDSFWRHGFIKNLEESKLGIIAKRRLENISLISITGGLLDNTLPADYTALTGLVPESNGFTIATTGIPGVWTPIDHLAIVWCDQLRKVLSSVMLQVVDRRSTTQTYPLKKRMEIFRKCFFSGFEDEAIKDFDAYKAGRGGEELEYALKIDTKQLKETTRERTFELPKTKNKRDLDSPDMHLFYIPKDGLKFKFNFISSLKPVSIEDLGQTSAPSVLLCRTLSSNDKTFKKDFDYTTGATSQFVQLECVDVKNDAHMIPRSYSDSVSSSESSIGANKDPFYSIQFDSAVLSMFDAVVIAESPYGVSNDDFILADLELKQSTNLVLGESSLWKLFTQGYDITLPSHRPIAVSVKVPSSWSSLLAYKFDIRYQQSQNERFSPIISQRIRDETKWHINIKNNNDITALIQGVSPFCPFTTNKDSALELQLFSDSLSSDQIMDIYMSVDWFKSLKLLVLKYRLSIISFPVFITTLIVLLQFRMYIDCEIFPSFGQALLLFCDLKILVPLSVSLSFLSSIASQKGFQKLLNLIDPMELGNLELMQEIEDSNVHVNLYFLGLEEKALWFFGPVVLVISLSLVCGFYYALVLLIWLSSLALKKLSFFSDFVKPTKHIYNRRRFIGTAILITLIPLYLPYQFAYVVCCIVQVVVVIKAFVANNISTPYQSSSLEKQNSSTHDIVNNFKNFNFSMLVLMLWILPVNIPVLIVWVHNFSLRWATPFSSHHSFMAVISIVLLIQNNVAGNMVSRPSGKVAAFVTKFILAYFSLYSLLYGTRHLFWLHYLFNFFCAWILILMIDDYWNGHLKNIMSLKRDDKPSKLH